MEASVFVMKKFSFVIGIGMYLYLTVNGLKIKSDWTQTLLLEV
jgi:hypothetical protein